MAPVWVGACAHVKLCGLSPIDCLLGAHSQAREFLIEETQLEINVLI